MYWSAVSAIAGIVAAIFVALSAVYMATQIKRNMRATHSQAYHLATSVLFNPSTIRTSTAINTSTISR